MRLWLSRHFENCNPQRLDLAAVVTLCIIVSSFWCYAGLFSIGFIDEDFVFLATGRRGLWFFLRDIATPHVVGTFRPWGHQMHFLLLRLIFGLHPAGFHVVQLALHMANAALAYFLFLELGGRQESSHRPAAGLRMASFLAAVSWAFHGSFSPAVGWIAAANNAWLLFFFLLALLGFFRDWPSGRVLFFFFMALMSKEFAVLGVPIVVCLSDRRRLDRKRGLVAAMSLVTIAYFVYFYFMNQGFSAADYKFELSGATFTAAKEYLAYLGRGLWNSSPQDHFLPWLAAAAIICAAGGWRLLGAFLGSLLFLCFWPHHVREEFLYLPAVFLFGALGLTVHRLFGRTLPAPAAVVAIAAVLTAGTLVPFSSNFQIISFYFSNYRERSAAYVRAEPLLVQVASHLADAPDGTYWRKLNSTLTPRGVLFTNPFLASFHPEILKAYPCYGTAVDLTQRTMLYPEVFTKCPN